MGELTVAELLELKKKFELEMAASANAFLKSFREKTWGRVVITSLSIDTVSLEEGCPRRVVNQMITDISCTIKLQDGTEISR